MGFPRWWNWLPSAQKSLVTLIKLPSFVIKIIDIGINHQNNFPVWVFQGGGTGCQVPKSP